MTKLKLNFVRDKKPLKIAIELPASVHRDLILYGKVVENESYEIINGPKKIVAMMVNQFMATDRAFYRVRRLYLEKSKNFNSLETKTDPSTPDLLHESKS